MLIFDELIYYLRGSTEQIYLDCFRLVRDVTPEENILVKTIAHYLQQNEWCFKKYKYIFLNYHDCHTPEMFVDLN